MVGHNYGVIDSDEIRSRGDSELNLLPRGRGGAATGGPADVRVTWLAL